VEGILAFAERVLPRAADLWVQASLDQRQRFQQLFFPDGIAFDGNPFIGTGVTAPAFSYLRELRTGNEDLVELNGIEPANRREGVRSVLRDVWASGCRVPALVSWPRRLGQTKLVRREGIDPSTY
jgi:hypothetical protein